MIIKNFYAGFILVLGANLILYSNGLPNEDEDGETTVDKRSFEDRQINEKRSTEIDHDSEYFSKRDDENKESDDENKEKNEAPVLHKKRLETVDGVEIASSYYEYINLALTDIDDKLKKDKALLIEIRERTKKREALSKEIDKETISGRMQLDELREQRKILHTRLTQNNEMENQLTKLADIAGIKLEKRVQQSLRFNKREGDTAAILENIQMNTNSIAKTLLNQPPSAKFTNSTYTRYIEMAYAEVQAILASDKQALVDIIRSIKDNEEKLKELEKLKEKVENSLRRLKKEERRLENSLKEENEVKALLIQAYRIITEGQAQKNLFQSIDKSLTTNTENISPNGQLKSMEDSSQQSKKTD